MTYLITVGLVGIFVGFALGILLMKKSCIRLMEKSIADGFIKVKGTYYNIIKMENTK